MDNSKVVILGTAHGVNTPGKCSPDKKFREYRFSREVINDLKPKLEALGLKVYIDITQDEVPRPPAAELSQRCRIVNSICAKHGTKLRVCEHTRQRRRLGGSVAHRTWLRRVRRAPMLGSEQTTRQVTM